MPAIPKLIDANLDAVREICRRHQVARLEGFGSSTTDSFDPGSSDLDFLVNFKPLAPTARANAYFGLLADLQDLFQCDIDLVETEAVTNPYFKRAINAGRTVLYAA